MGIGSAAAGAERSERAERSAGTEGARRARGIRRASRNGDANRRRPALAGLRLLRGGGLVDPASNPAAQECSGAERPREAGRRGGKAVSSMHDRAEVEGHGGAGELFVRTA